MGIAGLEDDSRATGAAAFEPQPPPTDVDQPGKSPFPTVGVSTCVTSRIAPLLHLSKRSLEASSFSAMDGLRRA